MLNFYHTLTVRALCRTMGKTRDFLLNWGTWPAGEVPNCRGGRNMQGVLETSEEINKRGIEISVGGRKML